MKKWMCVLGWLWAALCLREGCAVTVQDLMGDLGKGDYRTLIKKAIGVPHLCEAPDGFVTVIAAGGWDVARVFIETHLPTEAQRDRFLYRLKNYVKEITETKINVGSRGHEILKQEQRALSFARILWNLSGVSSLDEDVDQLLTTVRQPESAWSESVVAGASSMPSQSEQKVTFSRRLSGLSVSTTRPARVTHSEASASSEDGLISSQPSSTSAVPIGSALIHDDNNANPLPGASVVDVMIQHEGGETDTEGDGPVPHESGDAQSSAGASASLANAESHFMWVMTQTFGDRNPSAGVNSLNEMVRNSKRKIKRTFAQYQLSVLAEKSSHIATQRWAKTLLWEAADAGHLDAQFVSIQRWDPDYKKDAEAIGWSNGCNWWILWPSSSLHTLSDCVGCKGRKEGTASWWHCNFGLCGGGTRWTVPELFRNIGDAGRRTGLAGSTVAAIVGSTLFTVGSTLGDLPTAITGAACVTCAAVTGSSLGRETASGIGPVN